MKTPHLDLAAVEDQAAARLETLARLRHWYDVTKNPLYVWEAVARCLYDNPPTIPEWRLDYLRATASNLFDLSRRKDFRDSESTAFQLTDKQALGLVPQALSLSRKGKKNKFASLAMDRQCMMDANTYEFYGENIRVVEEDRKQRGQERSKDRIRQIAALT